MATRPHSPVLLTVPQVAAMLNVSRATVYRLLADQAMTAVTVRRSRRIPQAEVAEYLEHRLKAATETRI